MREELERETMGLMRAWADHDPGWLAVYLVSGVEDPRLNAQSILTRHFLVARRFGEALAKLRCEEHKFGAVLRWWTKLELADDDSETRESLCHALREGRDNAEGLPLPPFVHRVFQSLPVEADGAVVPNYLEQLCSPGIGRESVWDVFADLWRNALSQSPANKLRVLEPACGSANDCRFAERYGLSRFVDYTGIDLSASNIANARRLADWGRFEVGNVFELRCGDRSFDAVYVHDLFEHLSSAGAEQAAAEICRVADQSVAVAFFSMHEGGDDIVRAVGDYHCNTLSCGRMRATFERHGFRVRAIHLSSFLQWELGCAPYHNPNAYTFILERSE